MGTIIEDLYDHEGYGARRLPDGTLTGVWSAETARFEAYVASCGCGWHGGDHPPTETGYEAALDEWEAEHSRPLLAQAVSDRVRTAINDAKRAVADLIVQRPEAARRVLDEGGSGASTCGGGSSQRRWSRRRTGCAAGSTRCPSATSEERSGCSNVGSLCASPARVIGRASTPGGGACEATA